MQKKLPSSSSRKILLILALSLFIVSLILVIVSSFTGGSSSLSFGKNSYKQGFLDARNLAYELGVVDVLDLDNKTSISGEVVAVKNSSFVIRAKVFMNKDVDGLGREREIVVTSETPLIIKEPKDLRVFADEDLAYQKKVESLSPEDDFPELPKPYTEKNVSLNEINPGDAVYVFLDGEQDFLKEEVLYPEKVLITKKEEPEPIKEPQEADDNNQDPVTVSDNPDPVDEEIRVSNNPDPIE